MDAASPAGGLGSQGPTLPGASAASYRTATSASIITLFPTSTFSIFLTAGVSKA